MPKPKFTTKQQRFIDFYDGNATDAAREAGYKQPNLSGAENMAKHSITQAIQKREEKRSNPNIANREERQSFWTKVLSGEDAEPVITGYDSDGNAVVIRIPPKMADRLKASELLGRSEADFTDNQRISDPDGKALRWQVEIVKSEGE